MLLCDDPPRVWAGEDGAVDFGVDPSFLDTVLPFFPFLVVPPGVAVVGAAVAEIAADLGGLGGGGGEREGALDEEEVEVEVEEVALKTGCLVAENVDVAALVAFAADDIAGAGATAVPLLLLLPVPAFFLRLEVVLVPPAGAFFFFSFGDAFGEDVSLTNDAAEGAAAEPPSPSSIACVSPSRLNRTTIV